ncbi:auxin-responsive protein SAUR72-like [Malania oleifera]|uniref:auxin-responsive protein SAUR72-like n=1 Tax=Malania oleifera TaxID=397392 RepID=UPI0025ADAD7D|nr:auxin-responsive protein SAUR72-like [Malania oleifera]
MDAVKRRWRKALWTTTFGGRSRTKSVKPFSAKSSSEEDNSKNKSTKSQVAPGGCFTVCVGDEKQRFFVKTEFAGHPLFRTLLEDAELEYGYKSDGPIVLPCDVDEFYGVLAAMDCGDEEMGPASPGCAPFLCSPSRRPATGNGEMREGSGSYAPLSPSPMRKMNHSNFVFK